jgi:polysaccharide export outer membrane protein
MASSDALVTPNDNHSTSGMAIPPDGVTEFDSGREFTGPAGASPYHTQGENSPSLPVNAKPSKVRVDVAHNPPPVPRELDKVAQPPYVIEPPDILQIDAIRVVPKPPYRIEPLDTLIVQAREVLPAEPIAGPYGVESDGNINFGSSYGSVRVEGLTVVEAQKAIEKQLREAGFKKAEVRVAQGQSRALQQIRGQHLVRPDGTVGLGVYGNVFVAGLTLEEARAVMEAHLSEYLLKPELSVDVFAYNSKVFYVITSGGGLGEAAYRFPSTGSETVLDALTQIGGLPVVACAKKIWLSRPSPAGHGCYQVLPVDWHGITRGGSTETNYLLFPGDRIFVESDPLVRFDTFLARLYGPIERMFGFTLLGSTVIHTVPQHIQYSTGGSGNGSSGSNTGTTPGVP